MGCDIHIVVERQAESGKWERVPVMHRDEHYARQYVDGTPERFDERCYDLFGILANVRNGHGFAGIPTGSGWPSIAPDRGIPLDTSLTESERDDYELGDHSFTWVGLEELKAFDWDGTSAEAYGVVTRDEYTRMQREGDTVPQSWCGGISGRDVLTVTPEQIMASAKPIPFTHVAIKWRESAREATSDWPGKVIPWLEQLSQGKPLRLVFGFDS